MKTRTPKFIYAGLTGLLLLVGLNVAAKVAGQNLTVVKAIAVLHPTDGNNVRGTVTFTQVGERVKVVADIEGLAPGKHGFHLHEYGD